jgi:DNA-binding transcriptional LysR family regulator
LEILAKVEELESLCGQINSDWEPTLRVVYDGILPFELFLNIYKTFKAEKVPTLIQTYVDYLTDVEKTSNSLKAEIMISVLPINDRGLHTVYLKPLKNYLVACKDHPIHQSKKTWSVEELKEFSFLTIRGSDQKLGLNTQEFEESASFFLSDFSFKKEAIMKNMGFGWLPEHMIEAELKSRLLLPVKWERKSSHEIQPILYMHKSVVSGRAAQQIVDILKK